MSMQTDGGFFDELANDIGAVAALKLCAFFAHSSLYVPQEFNPDHILCRVIGEDAFRLLIACRRGEGFTVPAMDVSLYRNAGMVYRLHRYKVPAQVMATLAGLSSRRIRQIQDELQLAGLAALVEPPAEPAPPLSVV